MNTILDVLNAVDKKFSSPDTWCKGAYARNIRGHKVPESSSEACSWCLVGCVISVTELEKYPGIASPFGEKTLSLITNLIRKESLHRSIHVWNDDPEHTFADIKNIIKRAKESLINV